MGGLAMASFKIRDLMVTLEPGWQGHQKLPSAYAETLCESNSAVQDLCKASHYVTPDLCKPSHFLCKGSLLVVNIDCVRDQGLERLKVQLAELLEGEPTDSSASKLPSETPK
jgi:hypothetical protein